VRKYRFIDVQKATYPIRLLCRMLSVPESSYFDWHHTGRKRTAQRDADDAVVVEQISSAHQASDATYGAPRICAELRDGGVVVSKRRVAELMRKHGIQGLSGRERCTQTTRRSRDCKIPDLVNRGFHPDQPDTVWYGDITYIWVENRFWYLATVIDACTKQVLGWSFDDNMETPLIQDALKAAVAKRAGPVKGVIFHSDRASQYTSDEFARFCAGNGVTRSMGATGVCWDNAVAESFFGTLKRELANRRRWATRADARRDLIGWIEGWYNPHRLHSWNQYNSPCEIEDNFHRDSDGLAA